MLITLKGLVVRERTVGEADKFIDLLTAEQGLLEVSVRGAKKITGRSNGAVQLFSYATFCLDYRRERYYLNSVSPVHIFYPLREALDKLCLASYFCEVICAAVRPLAQNNEILRLTLNTLHFLEAGSRPIPLLKALFELRLITELGMMPNIVCCDVCGAYAPEQVCFFLQSGVFVCGDCRDDTTHSGERMTVSGTVLQAVRHIVLADFDRLFHFRLGDASQADLAVFAERYLLLHLERGFKTLDFFHSLQSWESPIEDV